MLNVTGDLGAASSYLCQRQDEYVVGLAWTWQAPGATRFAHLREIGPLCWMIFAVLGAANRKDKPTYVWVPMLKGVNTVVVALLPVFAVSCTETRHSATEADLTSSDYEGRSFDKIEASMKQPIEDWPECDLGLGGRVHVFIRARARRRATHVERGA